MNGIEAKILGSLSKFWRAMKSCLAPSPINVLKLSESSSQHQPCPGNTTSNSQAPPSPESPPGVRGPLPPTTSDSQRNNILVAKVDLEKELKKTLLSVCFGAALQIAIQCKQAAESEINNSIILLCLGTAAIFGSLFTSHFIVEKMPTASRVLDKVAFYLAATTFFVAIATPCPLGIKCVIWALYIISLIAIATCNFISYSGGALTHAPQVPVVKGDSVEGASAAGRAGGGNVAVEFVAVEVQQNDVFENSKNCSDD